MSSDDGAGRGRSDTVRRVVILIAALNLAYFGVEFAVALGIGSVSLFADGIDFLEDASVSFLIAVALGWGATRRARVGMVLAESSWCRRSRPGAAVTKLVSPVPPDPVPLMVTGVGALVVNLSCALILRAFARTPGASPMLRSSLHAATWWQTWPSSWRASQPWSRTLSGLTS